MAEKTLAALTVFMCAVLLLRLCLSARLRARADAAASRVWWRVWLQMRRFATRLWHWKKSRQEAQQAADAAIKRAQRKAASAFERDGNVYKPEAFKGPDKSKDQRDPWNLH